MPFGTDALVIYLTARDHGLFWLYPLLGAAVSVVGAAVTFWVGRQIGEVGLPRLVPTERLERLRARVQKRSAAALALPALLPPPFPLTPFVLTCGALNVNPWWFFPAFGVVRLVRFSAGALLALVYGPGILRLLESDTVLAVVIGVFAAILLGAVVTLALLWRQCART